MITCGMLLFLLPDIRKNLPVSDDVSGRFGRCFSVFFSAKCKSVQSALICAFVTAFAPMVVFTISNGRNLLDILRCIFPTSGLAFMNSLERELLGRNFVKIGSGYHWTPYIIVIAAGISIPLFVILALVSYCKKEY